MQSFSMKHVTHYLLLLILAVSITSCTSAPEITSNGSITFADLARKVNENAGRLLSLNAEEKSRSIRQRFQIPVHLQLALAGQIVCTLRLKDPSALILLMFLLHEMNLFITTRRTIRSYEVRPPKEILELF